MFLNNKSPNTKPLLPFLKAANSNNSYVWTSTLLYERLQQRNKDKTKELLNSPNELQLWRSTPTTLKCTYLPTIHILSWFKPWVQWAAHCNKLIHLKRDPSSLRQCKSIWTISAVILWLVILLYLIPLYFLNSYIKKIIKSLPIKWLSGSRF